MFSTGFSPARFRFSTLRKISGAWLPIFSRSKSIVFASSKTGCNSSSDAIPKISNTFSISGILQDGHGAQLFETKFLRAKKKAHDMRKKAKTC